MANILFVLTNTTYKEHTSQTGFHFAEMSLPYAVLTKSGHTIDFVSPLGGVAQSYGFNQSDPIQKEIMNDVSIQEKLASTYAPSAIDAKNYDAIFYVGGHGTMWDFPDNKSLADITASIYEKGGVVGAVCHGPAGIVNVKLSNGNYLVDNKDVAAFTNDEEIAVGLEKDVPFLLANRLKEHGARHHAAPNFTPMVQVSERLVTGQNPQSAQGVGEAIAKLLKR